LYWRQVTKENAKANVKSRCQMGQIGQWLNAA